MSPWIFAGIYGVGFVVSARRFAVKLIDNHDDLAARLLALATAFNWPLILAGYLIYWTFKSLYHLIFWRLPVTPAQRARKIAELEQENERLRRQIEEPESLASTRRPVTGWDDLNRLIVDAYQTQIEFEQRLLSRMYGTGH